MTNIDTSRQSAALQVLAESLEIPLSYYERAEQRYRTLGEWLERDGSTLATLSPVVYAQGSFRYGTVIRCEDGFDLDLVCELRDLAKNDQSQKVVKEMVGVEVTTYAEGHSMSSEPRPTRRCWHLDYADDLHFHIDILPAIPECDGVEVAPSSEVDDPNGLAALARFAIAITDEQHPGYGECCRDWPMSNPKGFGMWFEGRMRTAADRLFKARALRVEDIPSYGWKTPLQVAIQILKQHRNTMFANDRALMPISMIITTLAAQAYEGELDLREALLGIVTRMPELINASSPRIPNPVNLGEDFADKWAEKPELEDAFWDWHSTLRRDFDYLGQDLGAPELQRHYEKRFGFTPSRERIAELVPVAAESVIPVARVTARTEPWGDGGQ